MYFITVS
jgi:hypothetical protein